MYKKLFQLRIPSAWAMIQNCFGDEDPIVSDGMIVNNEFYKEDLLLIKPIQCEKGVWVTDESGYFLDLGWYPDSDPKGFYRLVLLRGDWENIVMQFQSKNRYQVRDVIELCFDLITQGVDEESISKCIELEYSSIDID